MSTNFISFIGKCEKKESLVTMKKRKNINTKERDSTSIS